MGGIAALVAAMRLGTCFGLIHGVHCHDAIADGQLLPDRQVHQAARSRRRHSRNGWFRHGSRSRGRESRRSARRRARWRPGSRRRRAPPRARRSRRSSRTRLARRRSARRRSRGSSATRRPGRGRPRRRRRRGRAVGFSVRVLMVFRTASLLARSELMSEPEARGPEDMSVPQQHDQLLTRPGTGFWPTTFNPKPSMPTMLFLLLVSRIISLTPRSIRIWAPTP